MRTYLNTDFGVVVISTIHKVYHKGPVCKFVIYVKLHSCNFRFIDAHRAQFPKPQKFEYSSLLHSTIALVIVAPHISSALIKNQLNAYNSHKNSPVQCISLLQKVLSELYRNFMTNCFLWQLSCTDAPLKHAHFQQAQKRQK